MTEVEQLEQQKEEYKKAIGLMDDINTLLKNPIFQKVIMDKYCVQECARYTEVSGDPKIDKDQRDVALEMARGAGHLKRWLNVQVMFGQQAQNELEELDRNIEQAIQEEDK